MLVARTSQDAFSALSAMCTHEGCAITGILGPDLRLPLPRSPGSTRSGGVVDGPARSALRQFATQFAGDVLTISA